MLTRLQSHLNGTISLRHLVDAWDSDDTEAANSRSLQTCSEESRPRAGHGAPKSPPLQGALMRRTEFSCLCLFYFMGLPSERCQGCPGPRPIDLEQNSKIDESAPLNASFVVEQSTCSPRVPRWGGDMQGQARPSQARPGQWHLGVPRVFNDLVGCLIPRQLCCLLWLRDCILSVCVCLCEKVCSVTFIAIVSNLVLISTVLSWSS